MAISLSAITKFFSAEGIDIQALRGVSLELPDGELLGIMRPSRSGKSTLLNIIGCLDHPTGGSYKLNGEELAGRSDAELVAIRNRNIGLVFRTYHLLPHMQLIEEVELPLIYSRQRDKRETAVEALRSVGLSERMHSRLSQLDPEESPLVAIARALVMKPELVVFPDDPIFELDVQMRQIIWRHIERIHTQHAVNMVLTPHSAVEAALCDRIAILVTGRLVACDTPKALVESIGGDRIDLRGPDADSIVTALKSLGIDAMVAGDSVTIYADHGADLATRLASELGMLSEAPIVRHADLDDVVRFHIYGPQLS
jgi:putative ABC transport system ATP-binding protein